MPDKKLTDSEIVKALECCSEPIGINCVKCPLEKDCLDVNMCELALDLINRLQAENERVETLNSDLVEIQDIRKKVNLALIAENAELTTAYKTAKAEAYKEFAERLTDKIGFNSSMIDVYEELDNLLKELVGDK